MSIHIGSIIASIIEKKQLSHSKVGKGISKSNKTVPSYFDKKTIQIDLLIAFCETLNEDLLKLYYDEEPMKSLRNDEVTRLKAELQRQLEKIERLENDLKLTQDTNEARKGQIALLNQQLEQYKTGNRPDVDPSKSI
jgi:hypothetical protein